MKILRSLLTRITASIRFAGEFFTYLLAGVAVYLYEALARASAGFMLPLMGLSIVVNNTGGLVGVIYIQRALALVFTKYPQLGLFAMGFKELDGSIQQMALGQQAISKMKVLSTVGNFGDAATPFNMTNAPITLSNFRQVMHQFTAGELNAAAGVDNPNYNLIDQTSEPMAIAIAKSIVASIARQVCAANFEATINAVLPYLVVAAGWNYGNTVLVMLGKAKDRGIPDAMRYFLVQTAVNIALLNDEMIVAEKNNPANLLAIQNGKLPRVAGFQFDDYPEMPNTDGNLLGFAGVPGALGYVARAPQDPRKLLPGAPTPMLMGYVTDDNSGFSIAVDQWIEIDRSVSTRMSWLDGLNILDPKLLIRLVKGVAAGAAGQVVGLTVINPGYGYRDNTGAYAAPAVTITADVAGGDVTGAGATATAQISAKGAITGFTITAPGANYTRPPLISIAPQAGGSVFGPASGVGTVGGLN